MIEPATRTVLDNGLTVIARPSRLAPVATFWVWYRVGSRNELPGRTGVSHWVEHMLFKGSEGYPKGEIDRRVSREGGMMNALTWIDWTTYFMTLPADRIDFAVDVEADRMSHALFDPDEVASERTVVISEREGHENSPMFLLLEEIQSTAIKAHPYHHEVIGWKGDLRTMTREDLYDHYRHHYHPSNAAAVMVGPYEAEEMIDRIAARFAHLQPGPAPAPIASYEPEQRGERRVVVRGEDPTAYVSVAWRAPAATDPDFFACQVLNTILGGAQSMNMMGGHAPNRSSRLYRALVETGLASSVSTDLAATIDPFLYTVSAVVRHGTEPQVVELAILREIERVREGLVTEDELARAKKQARAQFAYSSERVTDLGFWLGFAEVVADVPWYEDFLGRLDAVTTDDVLAAARLRLDERRRTTGHYLPLEGAAGTADEDEEDAQ